MSVISIRRGQFLGDYFSRGSEIVPEGVPFLAGAAFTFLVPTLLYCAVIEQLWPLYLMACNGVVGTTLGFVLFKKPSAGFPSVVPMSRIPNTPGGTSAVGLKKAA
jgi:hypothetical protein